MIAKEISQELDPTKLIQAGYSLLTSEQMNPKVTWNGQLSRFKIAEILTVIHKLMSFALTVNQMREFLVCFPIKSSRDQLAFLDVGIYE
jgi:hypothetical protein